MEIVIKNKVTKELLQAITPFILFTDDILKAKTYSTQNSAIPDLKILRKNQYSVMIYRIKV